MGRQTAIGYKEVLDFLRKKADGSAQLDIGEASLSEIEDGLETDIGDTCQPVRSSIITGHPMKVNFELSCSRLLRDYWMAVFSD